MQVFYCLYKINLLHLILSLFNKVSRMSQSYFALPKFVESRHIKVTFQSPQSFSPSVNKSHIVNKPQTIIQKDRKNQTIGGQDNSTKKFIPSFIMKKDVQSPQKTKIVYNNFLNLYGKIDQQRQPNLPPSTKLKHNRTATQIHHTNTTIYPFLESPIRRNKFNSKPKLVRKDNSPKIQILQAQNMKYLAQSKEKIPSFLKKIIKQKQVINTAQKCSFLHDTLETMPCSFVRKLDASSFQFISKIGNGTYGSVYLCQEIFTKFICALKKISKRKIKQLKIQDNIVRQLKLQSYIDHPNVAKVYGFFEDKDYIYIILEYMPGGDLQKQYISRTKINSEQLVSDFIYQICMGLKLLHQEDIIHRDIKPENIFFFNGLVKIGDFGCSIFSERLRDTVLGTLQYLSPEQLREERYCNLIDSWSVGILAYQLLYGISPFKQDLIKIINSDKQQRLLRQLEFPERLSVSDDAKDFIKKLLRDKADKRMSMTQALKHVFLESARKRKIDALKKAQNLFGSIITVR